MLKLSDKVITAGSCFSDHIGKKLQAHKFTVLNNPFGVIFNPVALNLLLRTSLTQEKLPEEHLIQQGELWNHFNLHSDFSALSPQGVKENLKQQVALTRAALQGADWLILTFGTAIVYEWKQSGQIVANCHKVPAQAFHRRLLSVEEIVESCKELISVLPSKTRVLLTVSPVRHLKETLPQNAVSKSLLRVACHLLAEQFPQVEYFPSYEILLDELRDYRFFKEDMLHPNEVAIEHIWKRFSESCMDVPTQAFLKRWQKVQRSLQHRSRFPASKSHQQFLQKLLQTLHSVHEVDVSEEINLVKEQIA
ncbi:GSCFA domain-containing protein [Rapidithrix thailandica]|uniref:GSCFA domain-containing protein n=1 Tax=Rapidithrix thailandica TaxID=413964 RepID=UPI003216F9A7